MCKAVTEPGQWANVDESSVTYYVHSISIGFQQGSRLEKTGTLGFHSCSEGSMSASYLQTGSLRVTNHLKSEFVY